MTNFVNSNEARERPLKKGRYTMSVPASTSEQIDTVNHELNLIPFCDYKVSFDGGTTFVAPPIGSDSTLYQTYLNVYTDSTKVYFCYSTQTAGLSALAVVIDYLLYTVEVV